MLSCRYLIHKLCLLEPKRLKKTFEKQLWPEVQHRRDAKRDEIWRSFKSTTAGDFSWEWTKTFYVINREQSCYRTPRTRANYVSGFFNSECWFVPLSPLNPTIEKFAYVFGNQSAVRGFKIAIDLYLKVVLIHELH